MKLKDLAIVFLLFIAANIFLALGNKQDVETVVLPSDDSIHKVEDTIRHAGDIISPLNIIPRLSTISLVVMCPVIEAEHLARFLKSLSFQSILPNEIIINIVVDEGVNAQLALLLLQYSQVEGLHFFVNGGPQTFTDELTALYQFSTSDMYSFFSCDALMHPQRLELLANVLENESHVGGVLHGRETLPQNTGRDTFNALPKLDVHAWNTLFPAQWVVDKCNVMMKRGSLCRFDEVIKEVGIEPRFPLSYPWITIRRSVLDVVIPRKTAASGALQYSSKLIMYNIQVAVLNDALGFTF